MPLVQAKCTNCGANLEIDNTKDAAICPYCGTAFIVEKAINNYNTTNQIHANTVNIYGGNGADFVIRGGVLERYNGAATEVVIPNSVRIIGVRAFEQTAITSVTIPDSVLEIRESAFGDCSALTSVVIPNSVQKIGIAAFHRCSSLKSVIIPNSVQEIGSLAFDECSALTSITISNSVQKIDQYTFSKCSSLTSVTIPSSVRKIGASAFSGCSSLTSITIPSSIQQIYERAFSGCTALRKLKVEGVPEIGFFAFEGCNIQIVEASEAWKKRNCNEIKCLREYRPQESTETKRGGCYVATAVYGSYDCPEVWTLRRFRDDTLDRTWYGRAFIHTYYAVSPTLVRWFGACGWFQRLFRAPLDRLVARLHRHGVQDTPYRDKY